VFLSSTIMSTTATTPAWTVNSWRAKPVKQQVEYEDTETFKSTIEQIAQLPPLISKGEVTELRRQLAEVAAGKRFLLQGGDCAERFVDCKSAAIEQKLKIMLQMSLVLTWGARMPTVRVARMAGQYAKPRSSPTEIVSGKKYFSFRGDNINGFELKDRKPDPKRLLRGYFHAASTLNYARALIKDGFADVRAAKHWNLGFVKSSENRAKYEKMVRSIREASEFVEVCGLSDLDRLKTVDLFVCHEALHLDYEEAMTREIGVDTARAAAAAASSSSTSSATSAPFTGTASFMNLGAHFIWIGDRTRQLDHAHVEYMRGVDNPIGLKVGPTTKPDELVELIETLCPDIRNQPGKVTLITRFGENKVRALLPPLIKVVQDAGLQGKVIWCCDAMHGNTKSVLVGEGTKDEKKYKTRSFDDVLGELRSTFEVHIQCGSRLGGTHLEMTGERVTECTGGPEELSSEDLPQRYTSYCDPRLNYAQSLEIAFLVADYIKNGAPLSRKPSEANLAGLVGNASTNSSSGCGDSSGSGSQPNAKRRKVGDYVVLSR
jgi:3-deoxy-7-phosphoheptulonate synthase